MSLDLQKCHAELRMGAGELRMCGQEVLNSKEFWSDIGTVSAGASIPVLAARVAELVAA